MTHRGYHAAGLVSPSWLVAPVGLDVLIKMLAALRFKGLPVISALLRGTVLKPHGSPVVMPA